MKPTSKIAAKLFPIFLLLAADAAVAQSSATSISFQGALNAGNGQPLPNGNYTLVFQFWNHPTGTAASNRVGGAGTVTNVAVSGGVASTAIPVQPDWFNGQTRYLGATVQGVNAGQELLPRVLVTAVPYSLATRGIVVDPLPPSGQPIQFPRSNQRVVIGNTTEDISRIPLVDQALVIGTANGQAGASAGILFDTLSRTAAAIIAKKREGSSVENCDLDFYVTADGLPLARRAMTISHTGSVGIRTTDPQTELEVIGTTRTTVLQITSARAAKEGFTPVDTAAVLAKVAALPIATWAYTNSHGVRHLGPVAEDFHAAFALGDSAQHIATVDADGVALAAIQGLNRIVQEQQSALRARESEVHALQQRLEKLERLVTGIAVPRKDEGQ